jgi:hypothetical protein
VSEENGTEHRTGNEGRLLFWSFAGTATFNRDPAILSSGLTRCVVRLQEEPPLERTLEWPAKIIKV